MTPYRTEMAVGTAAAEPSRLPLLACAIALAVALSFGCSNAPPGAGFTNGPPPTVDGVKPAVRTDLPAPADASVGAGTAEALGSPGVGPGVTEGLDAREQGLAGSDLGGTGSEAGLGGRGAGRGGTDPAPSADPDALRDASEEPRATPPAIELPNSGPPGGTRPGDVIKDGDPQGLRPTTPRP